VRAVAAFSVALGLIFQAVDRSDARAEQQAVTQAAEWIRARDPRPVVWVVASWGLQFHAEREGFHTVIPDESELHADDWLVVPVRDWGQPRVRVPGGARFARDLVVDTEWPLRTLPHYYGAHSAIAHQDHPFLTLQVYRLSGACRLESADDGPAGP
jgi:hypothetical protein